MRGVHRAPIHRAASGRPSRGLAGAAIGLAGVALVGAALLRGPDTASPRPAGGVGAAVAAPATSPRPFAPSLAGTSTEGLTRDAGGAALVLEPGLVRLFDHYLTTLGERTLAEIRAQIVRDLAARYAPAAARQAEDVLDRYLAYKEALRSEAAAAPHAGRGVDLLRERLHAMRAIRSRWFGDAEAQALFGPDDREANDALARLAVAQDPALDAHAKQARLAALDAAEPPDVRAAREASTSIVRLDDGVRAARAQGASDDDIWHLRAAATSPEAANRLADLDREQAAWQSRIADYLAQRARLLADGNAPSTPPESLAALRARLFTPAEQRRLPAYEH